MPSDFTCRGERSCQEKVQSQLSRFLVPSHDQSSIILLWLTPDDFTRPRESSHGEGFNAENGRKKAR